MSQEGLDSFVLKSIEALRTKLLDLTTRNPLLKYNHTARGRRCIRVIDELPDQLFSRISSGSAMKFKSIGERPDEPKDEKSIEFRRAVDTAKLADPEYRQQLEALGNDPGERQVEQIDAQLKSRLRTQLGMTTKLFDDRISADERAKQLGLNPSFDLPSGPTSDLEKHGDSWIQTLMFESDLQRILGKIRQDVNLSVSETGVNPLFMVLGFLEWYESDASAVPLNAPLMLLPIEIDRELKRGGWQYQINFTGEKAMTNITLLERLKRDFQLPLPVLDDDEDVLPEAYFAEVQHAVRNHKHWKVRRWATIGMFQFARIAMYRDLNPESWNAAGRLERHSGLRRLLGGSTEERAFDQFAPLNDHAPTDSLSEPPLIADADSSQLEAINQILAGRSMVVEGPPGTGKSQTITNLIAAALEAGKSVLFVCEKMAALTVVRDRLNEAGLGNFCLELHSTKANRRDVLNALSTRRNTKATSTVASDLQSTLAEIESLKQRLTALIEGLRLPAARLNITAQELLWRCAQIKDQSAGVPSRIDDMVLSDAYKLDEIRLENINAVSTRLGNSRQTIIRDYMNVAGNPWYGIAHSGIEALMAKELVRKVSDLANAADNLAKLNCQLSEVTGWEAPTIADLRSFAMIKELPTIDQNVPQFLLTLIASNDACALLRQFVAGLAQLTVLNGDIRHCFDNERFAKECPLERLSEIVKNLSILEQPRIKVADLANYVEKKQEEDSSWEAAHGMLRQISRLLQWDHPIGVAEEKILIATVRHATQLSVERLRLRCSGLTDTGALSMLQRTSAEATKLCLFRADLGTRFALESLEPPPSLRQYAVQLRSSGFFGFLSSKCQHARYVYRGVCKSRGRVTRHNMANDFDELARVEELRTKMSDDVILRALCGETYSGADSHWADYEAVAEWADSVRSAFSHADELSRAARRFLFQSPVEDILALVAISSSRLFAQLASRIEGGQNKRTVQDRANQAHLTAIAANNVQQHIESAGFSPDFEIIGVERLQRLIHDRALLADKLDNSHECARLLKEHFAGKLTDAVPIEKAIHFADSLTQSGFPSDLAKWLLTDNTYERIKRLSPLIATIGQSLTTVDKTLASINGLAPIDFSRWAGAPTPYDCSPSDLMKHARNTSSKEEALSDLVDDYRNCEDAIDIGLRPLIEFFETHSVPWKHFPISAKRLAYQSVMKSAIADCPALLTFQGDRFEEVRLSFRTLDHKLKGLRQKDVAFRLSQRKIDPGNSVGAVKDLTGEALIARECSKQQRHLSIRTLLERAGTSVQQLMPCFMMSPLSVAQFLKPGGLRFDLVVMDEASQLRTEDAAGAIARASQIVIVGDPKQLPPTSFFMKSDVGGEDDDEETVENLTSILDAATPQLPSHRLRWHYRSRHPSLVEFSNREFYSDKPLMLFPSPSDGTGEMGVKYVLVNNGIYRSRINEPEAKVVAEAAANHAIKFPNRSLGIVALNLPQKELLDLELDRLSTERPEFAEWRQARERTPESLFVKNLENVQGDERDTILISTVFGKDENGSFFQRFGPINGEGGHRRLNVLFTRAKYQTVVFSSFAPEDIRTDHTSKLGVRALKGFLSFARDRKIDSPTESGREADSDFEIAVRDVLASKGLCVVPQVGSAGFFIDLGVRHPDRPGEYVLGIECDGASYHSSSSARDRDRLRQEILERLGWQLYRIWSLDWFRHGTREKQRLLDAVQQAINMSNRRYSETSASASGQNGVCTASKD